MGAGSSSNKGVASRSRFSSWGSSIDEAVCGDHALCGDYPEDDLEGFPLVDEPQTRRNSVITNPYIEPTPRKPPKLRRALSEGEASVRRAYMTDYSDNSDDPDTDEDYPTQPNKIKMARSAVSLPEALDQDDFPNQPVPLPLTIANGKGAPPSRARTKRKKKKKPKPMSQARRPFSPSQLQNHPVQKLPKSRKPPPSRYSDYQPRPESSYSPPRRYNEPESSPRRYSEPYVPPMTSVSNQRPRSEHTYNYPNETPYFSRNPPKAPKKKKPKSLPPKRNDDFLADYHLPSQIPPAPRYKPPAPLKPIRKTQPSNIEPNYRVPKARSTKTRKREAPPRSKKKAPDYGIPAYTGAPTIPDPIIQSAPPIRKGARIRAPVGDSGGPTPAPFIVGKVPPPKTPYLSSP
ncbi:hypothetical protein FO519_001508 [Halicephalobus sp. NKZ332]|nr:hypothetical protein FO519_001508 [Halicephalobus sp. NKZ332]